MTTMIQGDQLRAIALGARVRKSGVSPANATTPLFTVTGGKVLVTSIVGVVTTAMSATVTSLSLSHDPTVGSAGALCAATVVTSDEAGTLYGVSGVAAATLSVQTEGGAEVPSAAFAKAGAGVVLAAGALGQVGTAVNTGVVEWTVTYVPIDDGASVVAA